SSKLYLPYRRNSDGSPHLGESLMSGTPDKDQDTAGSPGLTPAEPLTPAANDEQTVDYRATVSLRANAEAPAASEPTSEPVPAAFGRYEVRELHGRGGLGKVYLGYDPQLNRRVAIKIPIVRNAKALEKIALEARQLAQLKHPGIVTVYDAGMHNGQFYIVSDFVEGT